MASFAAGAVAAGVVYTVLGGVLVVVGISVLGVDATVVAVSAAVTAAGALDGVLVIGDPAGGLTAGTEELGLTAKAVDCGFGRANCGARFCVVIAPPGGAPPLAAVAGFGEAADGGEPDAAFVLAPARAGGTTSASVAIDLLALKSLGSGRGLPLEVSIAFRLDKNSAVFSAAGDVVVAGVGAPFAAALAASSPAPKNRLPDFHAPFNPFPIPLRMGPPATDKPMSAAVSAPDRSPRLYLAIDLGMPVKGLTSAIKLPMP